MIYSVAASPGEKQGVIIAWHLVGAPFCLLIFTLGTAYQQPPLHLPIA